MLTTEKSTLNFTQIPVAYASCPECAALAVYWPDADSEGRWLVWQHVSGCQVTSAAVAAGRAMVEERREEATA